MKKLMYNKEDIDNFINFFENKMKGINVKHNHPKVYIPEMPKNNVKPDNDVWTYELEPYLRYDRAMRMNFKETVEPLILLELKKEHIVNDDGLPGIYVPIQCCIPFVSFKTNTLLLPEDSSYFENLNNDNYPKFYISSKERDVSNGIQGFKKLLVVPDVFRTGYFSVMDFKQNIRTKNFDSIQAWCIPLKEYLEYINNNSAVIYEIIKQVYISAEKHAGYAIKREYTMYLKHEPNMNEFIAGMNNMMGIDPVFGLKCLNNELRINFDDPGLMIHILDAWIDNDVSDAKFYYVVTDNTRTVGKYDTKDIFKEAYDIISSFADKSKLNIKI